MRTRRRVQMARPIRQPRRARIAPVLAGIAVLAVVAGAALAVLGQPGGRGVAAPSPGSSADVVALAPTPSARPSARPATQPTPRSSPAPTARPPAATARPTPAATVTVRRSPAPRSASEFDLTGQAIDIGFPISADVRYRYRDNWRERRPGEADAYNHARVASDGRLLRLHDGIDIYGPPGAPVVAPFAGRVIDPATRWQPWVPGRYGLTVVIESTEPQTRSYTAIMVHLDEVWVDVGQRVERGEVIGVLGRTGNAERMRHHLHFELRAPFEIDWSSLGENRRIDAFNPYPSLVRADPKR